MAEYSGFFDALYEDEGYDREYSAEDFAKMFSLFVRDGVYIQPANQLMVTSAGGLNVNIKAGIAFIEGHYYILDEDKQIALTPNATPNAVQSVIVCVLDRNKRTITTEERANVSSILPVNDGIKHELVLASITIGASSGTITNANITDRRPDKTYCGYVANLLGDIDTSNLFLQFRAAFTEWFENIKGKLGEDQATSLLELIQANDEKIEELPVVRYGTVEPVNTVGKDGDIYIRIIE